MAAFCESNIVWTADKNVLNTNVETAVRLGYSTIIINNSTGEDALKGKKKGRDKEGLAVKKASEIKLEDGFLQELQKKYGRPLRQFTRFTTVVPDVGQTHKLQSDPDIKGYDIVAVQPTSEKTFQLACLTLDIDIISLDFTQRLPFHFKRTHVGVALDRGLHFEIQYTHALLDQHARIHTISNALSLTKVCKGKNVLLSSGCEKAIHLRGPYDVANLGHLFGLNEAQAKDAVSFNARCLILHAQSRRVTGTVMQVTPVSELPASEAWKVRETATSSEDYEASSEEDDTIATPKEGAKDKRKRKSTSTSTSPTKKRKP